MNRDRQHNPNFAEPLPDDFSVALRALDARIGHLARQDRVPAGLADRVFESSISAWRVQEPQVVQAAPRRLRLVGEPVARPLHQRFVWSQLALAASVAIVCVMGLWMVQSPRTIDAAPADHSAALAWALDPSHSSITSYHDDNISHLEDTIDLTPDDLTRELSLLVSRF